MSLQQKIGAQPCDLQNQTANAVIPTFIAYNFPNMFLIMGYSLKTLLLASEKEFT